MRLLRKKGTLAPTWVWHPILAARSDMEEVLAEAKAVVAEVEDVFEDGRDALVAELTALGVKLSGKPSVDTLKAKLAEAKAHEGE